MSANPEILPLHASIGPRHSSQTGAAVVGLATLRPAAWISVAVGMLWLTLPALAQGPVDPCAAPANAIVAENCQVGDPDWRPGKYSTDIQGYASAVSVAPGDSLTFFVDTEAPVFNLTIYRAGYYSGAGARKMSEQTDLPGGAQPKCPEDLATGLVSCANWRPSFTLTIPADWTTGVYMARFEAEPDAYNFTTFVVRDDAGAQDLVVQIPVTTYQAYNNYGGKSVYDSSSGACTVSESGSPRAVAVTFDRPYANTFDDPNNFLRNDHLWVQWLESQGYSVDYVTNIDVHRWGQPGAVNGLLGHRAFLSIGHDEYWTQEMWNAIVAARDSGVHLGFFSANTAYWRIRLAASTNNVAERVLVTYKTIEAGKPDPSGTPTSTWRDPAQYGLPENQLIGSYYTGDNDSLFFPIRVTSEMAQDRIYRYTGLQSLPPGTSATLGSELVGWEWDSVVASPLSPAGLEILAESPVAGALLTDAGNYKHNQLGEAFAHVTRYVAPSGAIVFSGGTIQWGWGLEGREPNPVIRQVTANVLADMGAQPATSDASLILDTDREIAVPAFAPAPQQPALVISNVTVEPTVDGAIITWQTNEPARGQVYIGETSDHVRVPYSAEAERATSHRSELFGLTPGAEYFVQTVALGADSAISISEVVGFKTLDPSPQRAVADWGRSQWTNVKCATRPVILPVMAVIHDHPILTGAGLVGGSALLLIGLGGVLRIWLRRRQHPQPDTLNAASRLRRVREDRRR